MDRNRETKHSCLDKKRHDYILSGLVYCRTCEELLEGESSKSNTVFYYRHPKGTGSARCRKRWRAEVLEGAVIKHLTKLAKDDRLLKRVLKRAEEAMKAERPQAEKDLSDTKSRLAKAEARRTNLVTFLSQDKTQVPDSLWADVRAIDQETQTLRAEVERLTSELATWQNQAPDVERFRAGLAGLAKNFKKIPTDQQYRLLRSVIDSLHVDQDGHAWIFLLEKAEAWDRAMQEGAKRKRAHGKVRGPVEWLRRLDLNQ